MPYQPQPVKISRKWMVAAAVVLVLSILGLVYGNQEAPVAPQLRAESKRIAPPAQAVQSSQAVSSALPREATPDAEAAAWYAEAREYRNAGKWREAVVLWEKAAAKGHPDALNNLGVAYLEGRGVEKDFVRGCLLMEKAAEKTDAVSTWMNLGMCSEELPKPDYAKAAAAYQKAASAGFGMAQASLGRLYALGLGVPQESSVGLYWMGVAVKSGYSPALKMLGECFSDRECSKQYHDPAIGYVLKRAAYERNPKNDGWSAGIYKWYLRSYALNSMSEEDRRNAGEYWEEWSGLDNASLAERALLESGAVKPQ
ncbi:MAG: tetratricopeptide repeat protein [Neisseria sp.]|uniref:tetratricopeptide repeat protein n=1 Tax=Neisseria sp. TaxID=192066 RepID=UPI0026DB0001|nr:tetratricopeptide repeat protein [Neisseria sp.]MDO4640965.1 tetratricopeptide repeat protein [Neisseria sp.]